VQLQLHHALCRGPRGRDRMVVGFTTTYAISAYHHWCCEFNSRPGRGDKICQWLATGRWFSPDPPVSSTNKIYCHDITVVSGIKHKRDVQWKHKISCSII